MKLEFCSVSLIQNKHNITTYCKYGNIVTSSFQNVAVIKVSISGTLVKDIFCPGISRAQRTMKQEMKQVCCSQVWIKLWLIQLSLHMQWVCVLSVGCGWCIKLYTFVSNNVDEIATTSEKHFHKVCIAVCIAELLQFCLSFC